MVYINKDKTTQILTNLLRNSLKHTNSGFVQIKVEKIDNISMKITIKDTGTGIMESNLEKMKLQLAHPYYYLSNTQSMISEENLGLGLIICYELSKFLAPPNIKEPFLINSESKIGTEISFTLCTVNKLPGAYDLQNQHQSIYSGNQLFLEPIDHKNKMSMYNEMSPGIKTPVSLSDPLKYKMKKKKDNFSSLTGNRFHKKKKSVNNPKTPSSSQVHKLRNERRNTISIKDSSTTLSQFNRLKSKMSNEESSQRSIRGFDPSGVKGRRYNCNYSQDSNSNFNKSPPDTGCNCFDILLVDDDDFNLLILEKFLSETKWKTRRALNGELALEVL